MNSKEQIEQWFVLFSDDIYKFLVYYTGHWDVDDLVQEVFIKAIKGFDNYEGRSSPKTWLLVIARNVAVNFERKKRLINWIPESVLQYFPSKEKNPEQWLELNETKQNLYFAWSKLKRNYKEVILLRIIKELSVSETADILNWSESKVKVTLHRALKVLEKKVLPMEKGGNSDEAISK